MGIKKSQLKKFAVKELKAIIKSNKLGKLGKKTKTQLISMIMDCEICKDILEGLSIPVRVRKPPSAKQIAARKRFSDMVKNKKKPKKELEPQSEARLREQNKLDQALQEPEAKKIKVEAIKEIKQIAKKIMKKKDFLDSIFGGSVFNFQRAMLNVIEEIEDGDKLEKFMEMGKAAKTTLLMRKFNGSMSLSKLISLI